MTFAKPPNFFAGFKTWIAIGFSSWMVLGITACGGGGGADSTSNPETPIGTLISAGAYQNLAKDWVIVLLPTEPNSAAVSTFYALNYKVAGTDIYSGSEQITGNSSVTLSQIKLHPFMSSVRTGSGTLSSGRSGSIDASLNFPESGIANTPAINLTLNAPSGYVANTSANLTTIQGNWLGSLSYGNASNNAFSINVSPTGAVSSYMSFAGDCQLALANLAVNFVGTNVFKFTARISDGTSCNTNSWANQNLTGAGFVTPISEADKTQRLYLVGVTPDGRGISFKADR